MSEEIKKQINLLEEEQTRVKQFINENNFNCTTAPWVIAKQYRDEIKKHIGILKMNLENQKKQSGGGIGQTVPSLKWKGKTEKYTGSSPVLTTKNKRINS